MLIKLFIEYSVPRSTDEGDYIILKYLQLSKSHQKLPNLLVNATECI